MTSARMVWFRYRWIMLPTGCLSISIGIMPFWHQSNNLLLLKINFQQYNTHTNFLIALFMITKMIEIHILPLPRFLLRITLQYTRFKHPARNSCFQNLYLISLKKCLHFLKVVQIKLRRDLLIGNVLHKNLILYSSVSYRRVVCHEESCFRLFRCICFCITICFMMFLS